MTGSEARLRRRRQATYLASAAFGGAVSFLLPVLLLELSYKLLQLVLEHDVVYYLRSLGGSQSGFALACAAAAGAQYLAASAFLRPAGRGDPLALVPGPAAGALFFALLSGGTFFGLFKYSWAPIMLSGFLGAYAGVYRRLN